MIEHWVHLRCAGTRLAQYTDTWTCHLQKESRLTTYINPKVHNFTTMRTDRLHKAGGGLVVVVFTHSLDPCLGGESDHPAFCPPASISLHLASTSITPAGSVHKSRGDSVVRMWVQLKRRCVSCVWVLQRGHSGDGCDLASTLCKYDLRKGDLFVLGWAMVRRVRRGSISSELLMCGGGVRSILTVFNMLVKNASPRGSMCF